MLNFFCSFLRDSERFTFPDKESSHTVGNLTVGCHFFECVKIFLFVFG